MHVCGGELQSFSAVIRKIAFFLSVLFLAACTERDLQMNFLSKITQTPSDLKITNTVNNGDMDPDATETVLPMEGTCSGAVTKLEVQNPQSKEWKSIADLIAGAALDCAQKNNFSFALPLTHIAPYTNAASGGDFRQDFQIRWYVSNAENETLVYYRTLSAVFKAPTVTVQAGSINKSSLAGSYTVSGTCSVDGGLVSIEGPFATSPASVTCDHGTYTATLTVASTAPTGATKIRAKHFKQAVSRAYGEAVKSVDVDVQEPVLAFTSPHSGRIYTATDFLTGPMIRVEGSCSESLLPVKILVNGSVATEATCSSGLGFVADIAVPEGGFNVQAQQTDAAGNTGNSGFLDLLKDTQGPGSFSILGARSQGPEDSSLDGLLTAPGLLVDFSDASGAVSYDVVIKDNAGSTVVCPLQNVSVSAATFASCTLQQNTNYKIYVQARDDHGNVTVPGNNGYSFKTQFPVPKIARIYTDTPNATRTLNQTVNIFVEFTSPVKFSGSVLLVLNTIHYIQNFTTADNLTFKYTYVVSDGDFAFPLKVTNYSVGSGASVTDLSNPAVNADVSIPADDGTIYNLLGSAQIRVDAVPPGSLAGLVFTSIPKILTTAPSLNFTPPAVPAGDSHSYWARVLRTSDSAIMADWTLIGSGSSGGGFTLSSNMRPSTAYTMQLKARDIAGNESPIASANFISVSCPVNYAYVYNPSSVVPPFCVAQFETKGTVSTPSVGASGTPLSANQMDALSACSKFGSGYALINNMEWNTLADLIRQQPANWTGGAVGTGILNRGNNSDTGLPKEVNLGDACWPAGSSLCQSDGLKRVSYLPYDQSVWDIAGNAWEVTTNADNDSNPYSPAYGYVTGLSTTAEIRKRYGSLESCSLPTSVDYCGFGYLDFTATGTGVIWRGGGNDSGRQAGVFATKRISDVLQLITNATGSNSGFRCVYHP